MDGEKLRVAMTPERHTRLRQALLPLIEGRPVTGLELEKVVGHITSHCMLNRPVLSCLSY